MTDFDFIDGVRFDAWKSGRRQGLTGDQLRGSVDAASDAALVRDIEARQASERSRRRARAGANAEAIFDHVCRGYEAAGRAWIREQSAPTKVIRSDGGRQLYVRTGEAGVDRVGSIAATEAGLTGHPIPFACDVKSSSTPSLTLWIWKGKGGGKTKSPALTPSQEREIRQRHERGEIAGVMVRTMIAVDSKPVPRWYWLDYPAWTAAYASAAGGASMTKQCLADHGIVVPPMTQAFNQAPDWLPVVVQLWTQRKAGP